ncbi:hypothetical protein QBZ16_005242 [Prototheca wickerhamii]|uniref:Uncharacterized protein n=1 Tax=Prototheca wickerhamii TaxID=3111 RepID=A0AAD9IET0_PROWI|nr:hypothetical protein QBZ16_005242 [Prototheca wickerhamii]
MLVTPDHQVLGATNYKLRGGDVAVPRAVALLASRGLVSVGPPVLECLGAAPKLAKSPKPKKRRGAAAAAAPAPAVAAWSATVPVRLLEAFFRLRAGPADEDVDADAASEADATHALLEHWLAVQEDGADLSSLDWAFNPRARIFDLALPSDWQLEADQPPGLRCHLFRYQRRALSWMLWRESFAAGGAAPAALADADSARSRVDELGRLLDPVRLPGGQLVCYDPTSASVVPEGSSLGSDLVAPQAPGGLLCDEMGLGKTVEIISLILANPPTWRRAGNTLVVCPAALVQQWHAELAAHAGPALRVEVYDGLRGFAPPTAAEARQTQAQREAELLARLRAGEAPAEGAWASGGYSVEREAAEAAARLAGADVVLTTMDVLRQEVHYSPDNPLLKSLRAPKRYGVPTCPLLQVAWWRLVLDEAQMVGSHSAAGVMVARAHAARRWCVTGTPIGGERELEDVRGLLGVRRVRARLRAGRGDLAWAALRAALLPLLWRNTKSVVAEEHALPPRSLRCTRLAFQPGEREFYAQVVQRCRDARDRATALRLAERKSALSTPKRPHASASAVRAEEALLNGATQLRLACTHPQLTAHWKSLQSDLQLSLGGTLSMEEIMARLVDKASFEQQNLERSLCACLNTLAVMLLDDGARRGKGGADAKALGWAEPASGGEKRPRLMLEALALLLQSFKVAEKGIDAVDVPMSALAAMPDISAASTATVTAWKLLQLHTATQLERLYTALGDAERAEAMRADAEDKSAYVRAAAEMEATQAESRLEATRRQRGDAEARAAGQCEAAIGAGFAVAGWGLDGHASVARWLEAVHAARRAAQEAEAAELEAQASAVERMLGTAVEKALAHLEAALQPRLTALERHVNLVQTTEAVERVDAMLEAVNTAHGGDAEFLKNLCDAAAAHLPLLTDYQRRKIVAQWFFLLPGPEVYDPCGAAARRAASNNAGGSEDHPGVFVESEDVDGGGIKTEAGAAGSVASGDDDNCVVAEEPQQPMASELVANIKIALASASFAPSRGFVGPVPGCVFKLDSQGLGYYRDSPPLVEPLHTLPMVRACLTAISRALAEHGRKQQRAQAASEDAGRLAAAPLRACQLRLEALQAQVQTLRLLKDEHVQEAQLRLRRLALADVHEQLLAAAERPPEKRSGLEGLRRRIASLKAQAQHLSARRRFMAGRAAEAAEMRVAEGEATGGKPAGDGAPPSECPICYAPIEEDVYVFGGCGHWFCRECSGQQVIQSGTCAICRARVTSKQVFRVAASSSATARASQACDPEARALALAAPIRGEWSIKIAALLARVAHLAETAPHEKCLVFSQYPAALDLVGLALSTNGLRHVSLTAGGRGGARRAIALFREDDEVRVFLLAHRVGAAGLTLVRANHVFLLEPSLNPAIEQQAVARVHRIGQIRPVTVHRLLIADTIEEAVLARQESKASLFAAGAEPPDDAEEATTVQETVTKEVAEKNEVADLLDAVLSGS